MNFTIPGVASAIVFILIFLINLVKGNRFGVVLLRSFISAVIVFGLFFALFFVFKTVLGVSAEDLKDGESSDEGDGTGQNFDATVGDEDDGGFSADTSEFGYSDEDAGYDSGETYESGGDDDAGAGDTSSYDSGFSDMGTSEPSVNVDGATIRDKLGYDASTEDLAKAIRTIMPRDDE